MEDIKDKDLIPANDFCTYHHISFTFIESLHEAGLVDMDIVDEQTYLYVEQLRSLEPLVRLHQDLDINTEGIEAIAHLLQRMTDMQREIQVLRQRLLLYEE
jgi:chaperone modulatory protein CbpM